MRKPLITVVSMLFASLVLAGATVFAFTLFPSEKSKVAKSQHDISGLEKGQYLFESIQSELVFAQKVLIIKDWDNRLYVHFIPTEKGKVPMPERWWGWGYYRCNDFGPEMTADGKIKQGGFITCRDESEANYGREMWRWSYGGKSTSKWVDDIPPARHGVIGKYLYLYY